MKLLTQAIAKVLMGLLCLGVLVFLPAGTLHYPGAWLLIAILFIPMVFFGIFLYCKAPELLKKRLNSKEENKDQKSVILLSSLLFLAVFVLSGLDFRFGWSHVPLWCVITAAVVFLAGYGVYIEVMRENAYLSRTVEIQQGQKVIDTGLYGLVRHPMYFATVLLFLAMPLVLGSFFAFLLMLVGYPPILAWRIRDEEKTLAAGLPGYPAYMGKVRYRILPFIW
jgi:protein-S-isoprenylcysteine O-methyltransferase Ste14